MLVENPVKRGVRCRTCGTFRDKLCLPTPYVQTKREAPNCN